MGTPLQQLLPGDASESFICSARTGLIIIGTLWPDEPARFNTGARRDLMGITIRAAVSHALLMAAPGS
jgi:hypothetical protein